MHLEMLGIISGSFEKEVDVLIKFYKFNVRQQCLETMIPVLAMKLEEVHMNVMISCGM